MGNIVIEAFVNDVLGITAEIKVLAFRYGGKYSVTPDNYTLVKYSTSTTINVMEGCEFNSVYIYVHAVEV